MRTASDTVREIRHLFETGDLSCSAEFRQLAQEYADAAADLAGDLTRCREIWRSGTPGDALNFNRRFSPPLTDRAAKLNFPERRKWTELCREYRAAVPEEPDQELLELLRSESVRTTAQSSSDLLQSWRQMARTGSPEEKMELLRKLHSADPANPAWRKNLQHAETAWLRAQLQKAAEAFAGKRDEELAGIYQTCMTAPLQTPVPSSAFAHYMEPIRRVRKQQLAKQLKEQLQKINNACSMGQVEELQKALELWDRLAAEPDAAPEEQSSLQIAAARQFLAGKQEERARRKAMADLQRELTAELDASADFNTVARLFHRLEQLDAAAVPEHLAARFRSAERRYAEEARRRNIRVIILGFLLAVLLAGGSIGLTRILQFRRECGKVCAALDALLKQDVPEQVLKEFDRVAKRAPDLAGTAEVRARKTQAEVRLRRQATDSAQFARMLETARKDCTEQRAETPEAEQSFRMLEKSRLYRTAEQQTAMTELRRRRQELLTLLQDRRDQAFLQEFSRIARESGAIMTQLENELSVDLPAREKQFAKLAEDFRKLSAGQVRKECSGRLPELADMLKAVQTRLKEVRDFRLLHQRLVQAQNVNDYQFALMETAKIPKLAAEFADARRQFDRVTGLQTGTPCTEDAARLNCTVPAETCRKVLQDLRKTWEKKLDFYVLSLSCGARNWHFYTRSRKVRLERAHGGLGGSFVSLRMEILLPEEKTSELLFRIQTSANGMLLQPVRGGKLYGAGLPGTFDPVPVKYLNELAQTGLDRADWRDRVLRAVPDLPAEAGAGAVDRALEKALRDLLQDAAVPPVWKLDLALELLNVWSSLSTVNLEIFSTFRSRFPAVGPGVALDPAPPSALADLAARLQQYFLLAGKAKQLFRQVNMLSPAPVGVLFFQQGSYSLRGFGELPEKVWVVVAGPGTGLADRTQYMEMDARLFAAPGLAEKRLVPAFRKDFFHGKIVFAPPARLPELPEGLRDSLLPYPAVLKAPRPAEEILQK